MKNRHNDAGLRGQSHPGFRVGSFRLGGKRKDRGQSPPVPAPNSNGVQTSGKAVERGAERDFGRMANPLAAGAYRSRPAPIQPRQSNTPVRRSGDNGYHHEPARQSANRPAVQQPAVYGSGVAAMNYAYGGAGAASPRVDEAESHRFNEEMLAPQPAESFTDYRTLRRTVDQATHPSYVPAEATQEQQTRTKAAPWSTMAAEADYEEDDEQQGPKILVVDRAGDFAQELAEATVDLEPAPEILRLSRSTQLIEVVDQEEPDILVLAPEEMTGAGLKRASSVHRAHPGVVIVLSHSDKDLSRSQIAAAGAEDLIPARASQDQLRNRITAAVETIKRSHVKPPPVEETPQPQPQVYKEPAPVQTPSFMQSPRRVATANTKSARVFTVASASGGCGKTFYATNLAWFLHKWLGKRVCIVDLDLQFGEVSTALRLRPKYTIFDALQREDSDESDLQAHIEEYSVVHDTGV
ncbi:MAG: hypothetical protein KY393_07685, partial [Actinobacteria bacterium]|nr:hypothetical protein [Actinomycetota bacterium]